jgi:hypothetical protein
MFHASSDDVTSFFFTCTRFIWRNSPSVLTPAGFLLWDWSQPYSISQIDTLHSRILSA